MTKPVGVQRKRTRGWKMPPNTVSVCRPGRWGNIFIVSPKARPGARSGAEYTCVPTAEDAVACFEIWARNQPEYIEAIRRELAGKNLACFCALDAPCHRNVLLKIANEKPPGGGHTGRSSPTLEDR